MKILVSGAAGYIGSQVMKTGSLAGHEMVGFDNFDNTLYPSEIKHWRTQELEVSYGLQVHKLNPLQDGFSKLEISKFEAVVNEMAIPGLAPSWTSFQSYMNANVLALKVLLDEVVRTNIDIKVVQASTSSVYGNTTPGRDLSPISPYGVSKLAAENLLGAYRTEFGLDTATLRYFSVFGGAQRPDMAYSKFINHILRREPILINGNGSQIRTNTHVEDVALATILAAEKKGVDFTVDISGSQEVTLLEAIGYIEESLGLSSQKIFMNRQAGDQTLSKGDNSQAEEILGWHPVIDFEQGIADQVEKELRFNDRR